MDAIRHARGRRAGGSHLWRGVAPVICLALVLLAGVAAGCSLPFVSSSSTPTPTPTATPQPAVTPIAPVWQKVAQTPDLFGLVVTETLGFTTQERQYLRHIRITWDIVRMEAGTFAQSPAATTDSPGTGAAAVEATSPLRRIKRLARATAAMASPSARFSMLYDSVWTLMRRLEHMSSISLDCMAATTVDEKNAFAADLELVAGPFDDDALRVTDWGNEMRNRYRISPIPIVPVTPVPTTSPTTNPTSSPTTNPTSSPTTNPTSSPTSTPRPPLTPAEAKQVAEIEELDAWLQAVMADTSATVDGQDLPWSDEQVNSFALNMSYLIDQCDKWLNTAPAGSSIAAGFREYQKGLSLVRKGAVMMNDAALANDSAYQTKMDNGNATMNSAKPYLKGGLAKMTALR